MPDKFGGDGVVVTKERDNFGGLKVSRRRSPLPKPKPAPQPDPLSDLAKDINRLTDIVAGSVLRSDNRIEALLADLKDTITKMADQSKQPTRALTANPTQWTFDVERNNDGFIDRIVAVPVFDPKSLN